MICKTNPDMWFAPRGDAPYAEAKTACGWCKIRRQCGKEALERGEKRGIWAGFDVASERSALARWVDPNATVDGGERQAVCTKCAAPFYYAASRKGSANVCPMCANGLVDASHCWPILDALLDYGFTKTELAGVIGIARNIVLELTKPQDRQRYARPTTVEAITAMPLPTAVAEVLGVAA
ncbi:WhiB family transcriptional regulator [Nocardia sp. MW-W600-9]